MNNENNTSSDPRETRFGRDMWIATWVTLVLPPVTGIFMLSFVGVFPFPEVFYPFTDYAAAVVLIAVIAGIRIRKIFTRNIIRLAGSPESSPKHQKQLKRLPFYYFGILFLYFGVGLVSTLYSLSTLHGFDYPPAKYVIGFLGVIPGGLITALPIFFYLTDSLGRFLAPHGVRISVAPIKLKLVVLGLFVPVLIDTLLIMYFYDRTGYFSPDTIGIWLFLIVIAAAGTLMAWSSFQQSLSPFVVALQTEAGNHKNVSIVPQSLDELGVLSQRWQALWLRVLDYEKHIAETNVFLRSDVQQRTRELESERIFIDKVLDNAGALVVVLDRKGHIVRFNRACENITGFSFVELRNRPIWDWLIPPEQLERVKQVFNNLASEGFESKYENELMTRDGGRVLVAWNNATIRDETGQVRYLVSIGIDISERHAAQQALNDAKEAAEKFSMAKSEFLSRMSHELRTPMNAILGFGQILQADNANLTEEQRDSVDEILHGGRHLLALINEVLNLAKIEQGQFETDIEDCDVSTIIDESLSLLQPQAQQRNISLYVLSPNKLNYVVRADRLRLKQVLINLLSNAIKYNIPDGEVLIETIRSGQDRVRIMVKDTGPGIPPDKLDKLFMPFERLDNVRNDAVEGTGIGLALSKNLMTLMQGTIGFENRPGEGCVFYLELPWVADKMSATPRARQGTQPSVDHQAHAQCYTVLYVEDNPPNLRLVSRAMQLRGDIQLITAHTGPLGLEMACGFLPELILLDINLPGMNGMDLLARLKQTEATRQIPVIAVTANATPRDIDTGKAAGFDEYLVKPLDLTRFHELLETYLPKTAGV